MLDIKIQDLPEVSFSFNVNDCVIDNGMASFRFTYQSVAGANKIDRDLIGEKVATIGNDLSFHINYTFILASCSPIRTKEGYKDRCRFVKIGTDIFAYRYKTKYIANNEIKALGKLNNPEDFFYNETLPDKISSDYLNRKLSDKAQYMVHLLQHKGGSANLKSVFLKQNLGKHFKRVVEELLRFDMIIVNNGYQVGKFSKTYQLAEKGWGVKVDPEVILPYILKTKNNLLKSLSESERDKNLKQMVADIQDGAYSIDQTDFDFVFSQMDGENKKKLEMIYRLLHSRDTWAACDTDGGDRVYTILQNLPKELRYFMKIDNQNLIEFDITNAQPFFLAKRLFHVKYYNELSQKDITKFYNLTRNGMWNTYLSNRLNTSVKAAKQKFIRYLFSNAGCHIENGVAYNKELDEFMQREFASIHRWILKHNKKNYVSIQLRKDESDWSHKLCNDLRESFHIKCFNVHDCIVIPDTLVAPLIEIDKFIKSSINAVIKDKKYEFLQVEYKLSIEDKMAIKNASINVAPAPQFHYQSADTEITRRINGFYKDFAVTDAEQITSFFANNKKAL